MHSLNHSRDCRTDRSQSRLTLHLPGEAESRALADQLAPLLSPGMVIWLAGDLGAGKTTLARAVLRRRGYGGPVKSPTYTLVEVYVISSIYWYHFDFYRFNEAQEFEDAGLAEYFRDDCVCLVEWPEKAAGHVPPADLELVLRFADAPRAGRLLDLVARSEAGQRCLTTLQSLLPLAAN